MKKGTAAPNAFIYIIFLLILAGIVFFGYFAITTITTKSDQVETITLIEQVRKDIETNSPYGNLQYINYKIPNKYDQLCFINPISSVSKEENFFINITRSNTNNLSNAFLIGRKFEESIAFKVPAIETNNLQCYNKSGSSDILVTMEGKGLTTYLR